MKNLKKILITLAYICIFNFTQPMEEPISNENNSTEIVSMDNINHDECFEIDDLGFKIQSLISLYKENILSRVRRSQNRNESDTSGSNGKRKRESKNDSHSESETKKSKVEYSFPFEQLIDNNCLILIITFLIGEYIQTNKSIIKAYVNFDDFMIKIILTFPKKCKSMIYENQVYLKNYFIKTLHQKKSLLNRETKTKYLNQLNNLREFIRSVPKPTNLLLLPDEILLEIFKWIIPGVDSDLSEEGSLTQCKETYICINNLGLTCQKFNSLRPELAANAQEAFSEALNSSLSKTVKSEYGMRQINYESHCPISQQGLKRIIALLKAGADPDTMTHPNNSIMPMPCMLLLLYEKTFPGVPLVLVSKMKDLNAKDLNGDTLLNKAIQAGAHDLAFELIASYKVNVNLSNTTGNTTLLIASSNYADDKPKLFLIIKALLERGANINAQNNDGETALMEIHTGWDIKLLELFQKYNADANLQDLKGKTALIILSSRPKKYGGSGRLVRYKILAEQLVKMGADINTCDTDGRNAYSFASGGEQIALNQIINELS